MSQSFTHDPPSIRNWVTKQFSGPEPKRFLELGAYRGDDTRWLAALPNVRLTAFEPDPRNQVPPFRNVTVVRAAISDYNGDAPFNLSENGWGREWTRSSSLRRPKKHLERFPVTFGKTITVPCVTLDSYLNDVEPGAAIDFIWADIQGAEGDMIRGGRETLKRTHYLYTEYSNDEMYEGQPKLHQIIAMIPEFRIVEIWPEDVLLENTRFEANTRRAA